MVKNFISSEKNFLSVKYDINKMTDRITRSSTFVRQIEIPEHNEEIIGMDLEIGILYAVILGVRFKQLKQLMIKHLLDFIEVDVVVVVAVVIVYLGYKKLNQLLFKQGVHVEVVVMFVFALVILLLSRTIF